MGVAFLFLLFFTACSISPKSAQEAMSPSALSTQETVPPSSEPVRETVPASSKSAQEAVLQSDEYDLEALHDPDLFTRTALEHIFEGSVNSRGVASGYHHEGLPESRGEAVPGTETVADENGVYEARVRVDGIDKSGNRGFSTFFPVEWTPAEVVGAIREAHGNRVFVTGNTWRGEGGGLSILMYLDDSDHIISAFPEYGG